VIGDKNEEDNKVDKVIDDTNGEGDEMISDNNVEIDKVVSDSDVEVDKVINGSSQQVCHVEGDDILLPAPEFTDSPLPNLPPLPPLPSSPPLPPTHRRSKSLQCPEERR